MDKNDGLVIIYVEGKVDGIPTKEAVAVADDKTAKVAIGIVQGAYPKNKVTTKRIIKEKVRKEKKNVRPSL